MAGNIVATYDFKRVIVTFGGVPITGFAEGSAIQIASNAETFTRKVGADGEVVHQRNNDNTHTVTLTLQKSSLSNDYLSGVHNADKLTNAGLLPLSITDLNGTTLQFWAQARISKDPDLAFNTEADDVAWEIITGQQSTGVVGGVKL